MVILKFRLEKVKKSDFDVEKEADQKVSKNIEKKGLEGAKQ